MDDLTHIGYITKPHGYKGAVKLKCILTNAAPILEQDMFLLEVNGSSVPFFIESISHQANDMFIVKFEDIDDEQGAKRLKSTSAFVSSDIIEEEDDAHPWTGFTIISSEDNSELGTIEEVIDIPNNMLAMMIIDDEEVMLPLNDALIQKVDEANQTIYTVVPDGLLNLNE